MRRLFLLFSFMLILLTLSTVPLAQAQSVQVATDRSLYNVGDPVVVIFAIPYLVTIVELTVPVTLQVDAPAGTVTRYLGEFTQYQEHSVTVTGLTTSPGTYTLLLIAEWTGTTSRSTGSTTFEVQAPAPTSEGQLAYDDGRAEDSWSLKSPGDFCAVRFSPSKVSHVVGVTYYIKQDPATFNVIVLDSGRNLLYEAVVAPTGTGWFAVDLSNENIVVEGDFYVAMKWVVAEAPVLGADETRPDGRSFFVIDGTWYTYLEITEALGQTMRDGDFMIRATVAPLALSMVDYSLKPGVGEHIYAGDTFTATFTIRNNGGATLSNVEVRVDSPPDVVVLKVTTARSLAAGSTGTWQVDLRPESPGTFEVFVSFYANGAKQTFGGAIEGDRVKVTLNVELKPVVIVLKQVLSEPAGGEPLYVGDAATITYILTNKGQLTGEHVEIKILNVPREIEIVEVTEPKALSPGATDEWKVRLKATEPGTYDVNVSFYVNGEKVVFQLEGEETDQFKITIAARDKPFLEVYGLYLGGLVAIIVAVAALMMRRRRPVVPSSLIQAPPRYARPMPTTTQPTPPASSIPGKKFCNHCGATISADAGFCRRCGKGQA